MSHTSINIAFIYPLTDLPLYHLQTLPLLTGLTQLQLQGTWADFPEASNCSVCFLHQWVPLLVLWKGIRT